jgi:hypothetical protein
MNLKVLCISALTFFGFLFLATPAKAVNIPDFPSCSSPRGTVRVSYDSGIHGIPGDAGRYEGSDIVYTVSDSQLVQCFCAASKSGIQTNWWKISSLSADQVSFLKNLGWIYIPSGSAWGLQDSPYMAQNSNINCGDVPQPTAEPAPQPCNGCSGPPTAPVCTSAQPPAPVLLSVVRSGTTAQLTWSAVTPVTNYAVFYGPDPTDYAYGVPNTGNVTSYVINDLQPGVHYYFQVRAVNGCMPSGVTDNGQVLGASTSILGLADTGNLGLLTLLIVTSIAFLSLGFITRRTHQRAQ